MLLIFDVDGVLANFEKLRKLRDVAHIERISLNNNVSHEVAEKMLANARELLKSQGKHSTIDACNHVGTTQDQFYQTMNEVPIEGNIIPAKDVEKVCEELAVNHTLVALTNTPYDATKKTLQVLGVKKYFTKIYSIDRHDFVKPSSDIFMKIMIDFVGLEAVSIGDSYEKDIKPAMDVGVKGILFGDDSRADYSISELSEISEVLKNK